MRLGAITKRATNGRAMVLRIVLNTTDITGPLSQFQSVALDKEGIHKLIIMDINKAMDDSVAEPALQRTFNGLWPEIENELKVASTQSFTPEVKPRSIEDMLAELLDLSRRQDAGIQRLVSKERQVWRPSSGKPLTLGRSKPARQSNDANETIAGKQSRSKSIDSIPTMTCCLRRFTI